MAIDEKKVADLVAQVLAEMTGQGFRRHNRRHRAAHPLPRQIQRQSLRLQGSQFLQILKSFEVKEYPIPEARR